MSLISKLRLRDVLCLALALSTLPALAQFNGPGLADRNAGDQSSGGADHRPGRAVSRNA